MKKNIKTSPSTVYVTPPGKKVRLSSLRSVKTTKNQIFRARFHRQRGCDKRIVKSDKKGAVVKFKASISINLYFYKRCEPYSVLRDADMGTRELLSL